MRALVCKISSRSMDREDYKSVKACARARQTREQFLFVYMLVQWMYAWTILSTRSGNKPQRVLWKDRVDPLRFSCKLILKLVSSVPGKDGVFYKAKSSLRYFPGGRDRVVKIKGMFFFPIGSQDKFQNSRYKSIMFYPS